MISVPEEPRYQRHNINYHHHLSWLLWPCTAYLYLLAVKLHQPLSEVHPDRGLGLFGELSSTKAVGEAGLPNTRVPDHDDFEDAGPRRRQRRARQRPGKIYQRATLRHVGPAGWMPGRGEAVLYSGSAFTNSPSKCPNSKVYVDNPTFIRRLGIVSILQPIYFTVTKHLPVKARRRCPGTFPLARFERAGLCETKALHALSSVERERVVDSRIQTHSYKRAENVISVIGSWLDDVNTSAGFNTF